MKKRISSLVNILSTNKKLIITAFVAAVLGALVMTLFFPKRIVKLENGEEVLVEVKNHKFTADDLFKELKLESGNVTLFGMIDMALLKDYYPNKEEEVKDYVEEQKKAVYSSYEEYYGTTKEQFLLSNGYKDESEFEKEIERTFYYNLWYDEYVESTVTKKEKNEFYKNSVFGEKSIYLFSVDDENKTDLEGVRKRLEDKKSFSEIKADYTNVSSQSYESVKYTDLDTFTQNILDKIASTKSGKMSDIFKDDTLGNVLIYVVDAKEKPELADIEEEMTKTLVKSKQKSDESLYYKAFVELREKNDLNIFDTELKEQYEESKKQIR